MKRFGRLSIGGRVVVALCSTLFTSGVVFAEPEGGRAVDAAVVDRLAEYMEARASLGHFNGSVLVARDGRPLLSRGYGMANLETGAAATPETVYRVASITKPFTAMAVMILRDRGRLSLDDAIGKHLSGCPDAWAKVTIRHLLGHTSGIPDYEAGLVLGSPAYTEFMGRPGVPARIIAEAKSKPLEFEPGAKFNYCNTGYVLLGAVVEAASGVTFDEFLRVEIFEPLGMTASRHDREGDIVPGRAMGYELAEAFSFKRLFAGLSLPRDFRVAPAMWMTPPQGDAGLLTTTVDLLKWDQALYGSTLVKPETVAEMFTPGLEGYGLGWNVDSAADRRHAYHNGVLPGFVSRVSRLMDERITIILLGNTDMGVDRIASDLIAIVRGEAYTLPKRRVIIDLSPEQAGPISGAYKDGQGRVLEVKHDGEMVTVGLKGRFVSGLLAESPTSFFSVMFNGPVVFEVDETGRGKTIDIWNRGVHWRAERVADEGAAR